jgi:hypothetical protein
MGKREQAADEAEKDLDRVFPNTKKAKLPVWGYDADGRGPLVREDDPRATKRRG